MKIRIVLISNIIFEPYLRTYIFKLFSASTSDIQLTCVPYEEINEKHIILQSADIIALCLNFDILYPNALNDVMSAKILSDDIVRDSIKRCKELYFSIKSCSNAHIIWFGFEDYYINNDIVYGNISALSGAIGRINQNVSEMLMEDVCIDLKRLIAQVGICQAYSVKGKYRWNAPYSKELVRLISKEVYKQYLIHNGITKKCLVLDCDNVLWGGIVSEEGIENIRLGSGLGRSYQDFQRFLLTLYYHGVILAICSKNDESDVMRVFREHSCMILKEENIACFKINWNNKADNIKKISDELNIGLDSIVFIDDSEFEINSVRTILPEVTCILYDRDTVYDNLSCFNLKNKVDIDKVNQRNDTYKSNVYREELRKTLVTFDDYIKSLEMNVDIHEAKDIELARISELTQRANKCTNGKRYTVEELKSKIKEENYQLYSVSVSDKFSDLGIVGTIGIEKQNTDLFVLSCRALGREVEDSMIELLSEKEIKNFSFKSTGKNEELYNKLSKFFIFYELEG